MNKNLKGAMYTFISLAFILVILIFLPPGYLPAAKGPATATPQDTLTPTSTNTVFTVHINYDTACRSGPHETDNMITKVEQGKDMMLLAKDKEPAEWLLLRPVDFKDCWVDAKFVTSYDIPAAAIFPTPVPPTATLEPTLTLPPTKTVTPSATDTERVAATSAATRTRRPGDTPIPVIATDTSHSPVIATPDPGNPADPSNTPRPIVTTQPSNTPHPSNTPRPSNTPCPTNQGGHLPPGQCR
jgi:hypothetical protein